MRARSSRLLFLQLTPETARVLQVQFTSRGLAHFQSVKAADGKQRAASVTEYGIYGGHYNTSLFPPRVQPAYKGRQVFLAENATLRIEYRFITLSSGGEGAVVVGGRAEGGGAPILSFVLEQIWQRSL